MNKVFVALVLAFILSMNMFAEERGSLKVTVERFETMKGYIKIAVYNSADGFPSDISKSITYAGIKVTEGRMTAIFENMPYGEYGVTVYYDENSNGKLDTGMFGIPKEAVGTSNNPKSRMGPPLYNEAKFVLAEREKAVLIKIAQMKK